MKVDSICIYRKYCKDFAGKENSKYNEYCCRSHGRTCFDNIESYQIIPGKEIKVEYADKIKAFDIASLDMIILCDLKMSGSERICELKSLMKRFEHGKVFCQKILDDKLEGKQTRTYICAICKNTITTDIVNAEEFANKHRWLGRTHNRLGKKTEFWYCSKHSIEAINNFDRKLPKVNKETRTYKCAICKKTITTDIINAEEFVNKHKWVGRISNRLGRQIELWYCPRHSMQCVHNFESLPILY